MQWPELLLYCSVFIVSCRSWGIGMPIASSMKTSALPVSIVSRAAPIAAWLPPHQPSSPPRSSSSFRSSGPSESWSASPIPCSSMAKVSVFVAPDWAALPIADERSQSPYLSARRVDSYAAVTRGRSSGRASTCPHRQIAWSPAIKWARCPVYTQANWSGLVL